jgi:hypothetical protein
MGKVFLALVPLLVLFGAINTIRRALSNLELKLQNIQVIDGKGKFFHPFMQTILMFIG